METLYRKYRPKQFSDFIDQDFVKTILINSIKNNKISHAYLFSGPRGTGKSTWLKMNYPDFDQGEMLIGALGTQVLDKAEEEGLRVDVQAPAPGNPSIFTAIDQLLQKTNGRRR